MKTSILLLLMSSILVAAAYDPSPKGPKFAYYHVESHYGYCVEWVEEKVDPGTLPEGLMQGACPQEVLVNGTQAFRQASCPTATSAGKPEMLVFYSRIAGDNNTSIDMTGITPAEMCKGLGEGV
jgi:hypothetical protein